MEMSGLRLAGRASMRKIILVCMAILALGNSLNQVSRALAS
jgi:hypothetical protein